MDLPNLMICGHGQHGKDTLAELLSDIAGFKYASSSLICSRYVYNLMRDVYGYKSPNECFLDRRNHRADWYDAITRINTPDPTSLAKQVLLESNIYVGMRSLRELNACKHENLFDHYIWVDASERMPPEGSDSIEIGSIDCDIIIDNNGPPSEFRSIAVRLADSLIYRRHW